MFKFQQNGKFFKKSEKIWTKRLKLTKFSYIFRALRSQGRQERVDITRNVKKWTSLHPNVQSGILIISHETITYNLQQNCNFVPQQKLQKRKSLTPAKCNMKAMRRTGKYSTVAPIDSIFHSWPKSNVDKLHTLESKQIYQLAIWQNLFLKVLYHTLGSTVEIID